MNGGGTMTITEQLVLGIDIGGTNMRFGLVNDALELTAFERLSTCTELGLYPIHI